MTRVSLVDYMHRQRTRVQVPEAVGPFVTISRQYGCWGFSLAMLLVELLDDRSAGLPWQVYGKEILSKLAAETNMAEEFLDRERRSKPRMLVEFFRTLSQERIPSGYEIRNRITTIIRGLAIEGNAIVLGQGSAGATADLPNGLSVRLEAPKDWRVEQVVFREGLSATQARMLIRTREQEREYLRKLYEIRFPRKPAFHLVYDCSVFTIAQIAQQVVLAMKLRGLI